MTGQTVDRAQVRRDGRVLHELADSNEAFCWFIGAYPFSTLYACAFDGFSVTDQHGRHLPDWEPVAMGLELYRREIA